MLTGINKINLIGEQEMIPLTTYIDAWFATKSMGKKIQEQKDGVREMEQLLLERFPNPVIGPFDEFPNYPAILSEYKKNLSQSKPTENSIFVFGDSIANQLRTWGSWLVDPNFNFSYPGMWAHHIAQMIVDIGAACAAMSFSPSVILIGTTGGNNLLNRQEINATVEQVKGMLNLARHTFPKSKLIIYGLPQTIVAYLIENKPRMNVEAMIFMMNDGNTVFLKLEDGFVADKHVLPLADESKDGVHFTPLGIMKFCSKIQKGIKAVSGAVIY